MFHRRPTSLTLAVAALLFTAGACVVSDGGSGGSGSDDDASSGNASGGSGGAGGSTSSSTGGGGNTNDDAFPGPSSDLAPEATVPGAYVCSGCPTSNVGLDDVSAGEVTTYDIDGTVSGEVGHGRFLVFNSSGQFAGGGLPVDDSTGDFAQQIPLFCGENILKMYFSNTSGRSTFVRRITNSGCIKSDVRVTVAWDASTEHWGTHLVRFGGNLEDPNSDCRSSQNCYPDSNLTDWGIIDDHSDDPVQDLSRNYIPMAVENIYYPKAEDGLTVAVDNKDDFGSQSPNGTLYINVKDQPTYVRQLEAFQPKHVFIAASVDGAKGELNWLDEMYDCSADWDLGECGAVLP